MARAKIKPASTESAAARLDHLRGNALILRQQDLWAQYQEAVRMAQLLGYTVTMEGNHHRVTLC